MSTWGMSLQTLLLPPSDCASVADLARVVVAAAPADDSVSAQPLHLEPWAHSVLHLRWVDESGEQRGGAPARIADIAAPATTAPHNRHRGDGRATSMGSKMPKWHLPW